MRRLIWSLGLVLAVAAGVAGGATAPGYQALRVESSLQPLEFVPGELLVKFKPGVDATEQAGVLALREARIERALRLPRLKLVRLPKGQSVEAAAAALSRRPEVAYAEPNWLRSIHAAPNDTRFSELWALHQASDADIDAPEAWDVTTGSSGVIVAVVDTGVSYEHPDLAPNIWTNDDPPGGGDDDGNGRVDDTHGWDFVQNDSTPFDYDGHGTHVAGTIGAQGNNALGLTGVNWDVSIMALRACCVNGQFPDSTIVDAFAYACANGAKVVNGSFGSPDMGITIRDAVLACPNVLFVFSSGNEGKDLDGTGAANDAFPCELHRPPTNAPNVLCVGATEEDDTITDFSNHGTRAVHLAAPGQSILSTWPAYEARPGFPDGFEGAQEDFDALWGDRTSTAGDALWDRTSTAKTGSFSLTDSPGGNYADLSLTTIRRLPAVDLSGRIGCLLDYEMRLETQLNIDIFEIRAGVSPTSQPTFVAGWSGSTLGEFIPFTSDLSLFDDVSNVFIRFRLVTNNSVNADGVYLDDIVVRCLDPDAEDYNAINGTSMASPHVSGVAGLLLAQDDTRTVSELKTLLTQNVDALFSLTDKASTQGRLNACRALGGTDTECGTSPPAPPPLPPAPGDQSLDSAFGGDGIVTTAVGAAGQFDVAHAAARQLDGKLVVVGSSDSGPAVGANSSFAVARYEADGDLDPTFGDGDGIVTTHFVATANQVDEARAVAIQLDGKIVVAGVADPPADGNSGDFAVARYESDGDLDFTFGGGDGMVTTGISHDEVWGVAVQPLDGKIVVVGEAFGDFALVRYDASGNLDMGFDGDGKVTTNVLGTADEARAVAIQPDGMILAAGAAGSSINLDFALARYTVSGALDGGFDNDGKVTTPISTTTGFLNDIANAVALEPDGEILLGGSSQTNLPAGGIGPQFALARYTGTGALDTDFSDDGKVTTIGISPTGSASSVNGLGLQADGKIVAAGDASSSFVVARYTSEGNLDPSFDGDGKRLTDVSPGQFESIRGVLIEPDGKIVGAGFIDINPGTFERDFAVARYHAHGDSTPAETTIYAGPSGATNDATPRFDFVASESEATFECRVDADPFAQCDSPHITATLPDGAHTFEVRSIDEVGVVEQTPASRAFILDATPDTTIDSGPAEGSLINDSTPTFTFSSDDPLATFECRVGTNDFAACSSPHTTADLNDGARTFEVRAVSLGTPDPTPASRSFTVDTDPPETTIDSGPSNGSATNDATPTFEFSSDDPLASFECRVDSDDFADCTSPHTTDSLADGARTFEVQATDQAGNADPTPATRSFTVDTDPPETTIDAGTNGPTRDVTPEWNFSSDEPGATFQCRLLPAAFAACTSPHETAALADGPYTFEVRAKDAAGNLDASPEIRNITVDTDPPETTIDSGPANGSVTNDSTPTFEFSSEPGASFQCRVAPAAFATCLSPHTTAALADGARTFDARATDAAGNIGAAASRSFTVDTDPPETTIDSGPANGSSTNDSTPTFEFSSEPGASFQCRVAPAAFATCLSPHTTAALADGARTFDVRATDAVGNTGAAASRSFTVDTDPPETTIILGPDGPTHDLTPEWGFTSDEPGGTFECRLLPAGFTACSSPNSHETAALADGPYTFEVRAKDAAGNVDGSPEIRNITVDTVDPTSSITFADDGQAYQSSAYNDGCEDETPDLCGGAADVGSGVSAVQVSIQRASDGDYWDGTIWGATEVMLAPDGVNPWTLGFTPDEDTYTVTARAIDNAGNVEETSVVTFTVDDTAPQTAIASGPSGATNDSTPTFTFSSEPGSTFQCRLIGPDFTPCATPFTPSAALADGPYTLEVVARDAAGNVEPTAASQSFTVDTDPPDTTITAGPGGTTNVSFSFTSDEAGSFLCVLDGALAACSSPASYSGLAPGMHTFQVTAVDLAGNPDPSPASATWEVAAPPPPPPPPPPPGGSGLPFLTVSNAKVKEGNRGTKSMVFLVKLSAASATPVTFGFATKPGTAKPKQDFLARKGTLAFAPGQTVLKLVVKVKGDRRKEKHEKFQVVLASAVGATIADGIGVGTIRNND